MGQPSDGLGLGKNPGPISFTVLAQSSQESRTLFQKSAIYLTFLFYTILRDDLNSTFHTKKKRSTSSSHSQKYSRERGLSFSQKIVQKFLMDQKLRKFKVLATNDYFWCPTTFATYCSM
jgi:hypothetical protein